MYYTNTLSSSNLCPECRGWCVVVLLQFHAVRSCTHSILYCKCLFSNHTMSMPFLMGLSALSFYGHIYTPLGFPFLEVEVADFEMYVKLEISKEHNTLKQYLCDVFRCFLFSFLWKKQHIYCLLLLASIWIYYLNFIYDTWQLFWKDELCQCEKKAYWKGRNGQKRSHCKERRDTEKFNTLFLLF